MAYDAEYYIGSFADGIAVLSSNGVSLYDMETGTQLWKKALPNRFDLLQHRE